MATDIESLRSRFEASNSDEDYEALVDALAQRQLAEDRELRAAERQARIGALTPLEQLTGVVDRPTTFASSLGRALALVSGVGPLDLVEGAIPPGSWADNRARSLARADTRGTLTRIGAWVVAALEAEATPTLKAQADAILEVIDGVRANQRSATRRNLIILYALTVADRNAGDQAWALGLAIEYARSIQPELGERLAASEAVAVEALRSDDRRRTICTLGSILDATGPRNSRARKDFVQRFDDWLELRARRRDRADGPGVHPGGSS